MSSGVNLAGPVDELVLGAREVRCCEEARLAEAEAEGAGSPSAESRGADGDGLPADGALLTERRSEADCVG